MSAADERIAALKLRFLIERSGAQEALKTIDKIKTGYQDIEAIEKGVNREGVAMAQAIVRTEKDAEKQAQKLADAFGFQADELKRVGKESKNVGFLTGATREKLGQIRTENRAESFATRTIAGVLPGNIGGQASQIFELIDAIPDLDTAFEVLKASIGDTIGVLGATGVGLIGGLIALGAAIAFFQAQNEKAKESINALISTQAKYYDALGGTKEQLEKARDAQRDSVNSLRARVAENQRVLGQFENEIGGAGRALADAFNLGGAKTLREETQKLEGELKSAEFLLGRYNAAIENNATASADAAAALQEWITVLDDLGRVRIQQNIEATKLDSKSARERLDAIQTEIDYTEQEIQQGGLSADAIKELTNRLYALHTQAAIIDKELAGIDFRTQRTDTIAAVKKYNDDLSKVNEQARDAETAAHNKYADTLVSIAEKAADAAENALRKLKEKQQDLAIGLSRDMADADVERYRNQIDAQLKFADEEAKDARAHAKDMRRIRQEGARDESQAIQDRDAVALDAAQTRTRQQLQDAKDDYGEQRRERLIALQNELRDQQIAFQREAQDRQTKYQRDLVDAQTQYARETALADQNRIQALAKAAQAYQQEQAQLAQKYALERTQRQGAITAELNLIAQGYQQRARVQAMYENQLVAQSQRILGQLGQARTLFGSGGPDTGTVVPFARGGNAPANRNLLVGERGPELVRFRQPARIYSANQTQQMNSGRSLTVNLQGATMKTIEATSKAHALEIVGVALDEMGAS